MIRSKILLFAVALLLLAAPAAPARTWTDASGRLHVEAEFVTVLYGKIWLLRDDGRMFGVEPGELSEGDQEHVRELMRRKASQKERATSNPPGRIPYGRGRELCRLANQEIDESSGLACSRRKPGFFWTHNDSGDEARVYLFDMAGRDLGSCRLKGVFAFDFEDIFSFQSDGKNYLVLCDVGNNVRAAPVQILHVIEEPPFDPRRGVEVRRVPVIQTIFFSYEDDQRDCEAVGIDSTSKTILLVTKEKRSPCWAYSLAWPAADLKRAVKARKIASLKIPPATGLDVSPDGRRAVVSTYGSVYEYVRAKGEDWAQAFAHEPREILAPDRVQGESICYGPDGKTLYLTSEKLPTPLLVVPALPSPR